MSNKQKENVVLSVMVILILICLISLVIVDGMIPTLLFIAIFIVCPITFFGSIHLITKWIDG